MGSLAINKQRPLLARRTSRLANVSDSRHTDVAASGKLYAVPWDKSDVEVARTSGNACTCGAGGARAHNLTAPRNTGRARPLPQAAEAGSKGARRWCTISFWSALAQAWKA